MAMPVGVFCGLRGRQWAWALALGMAGFVLALIAEYTKYTREEAFEECYSDRGRNIGCITVASLSIISFSAAIVVAAVPVGCCFCQCYRRRCCQGINGTAIVFESLTWVLLAICGILYLLALRAETFSKCEYVKDRVFLIAGILGACSSLCGAMFNILALKSLAMTSPPSVPLEGIPMGQVAYPASPNPDIVIGQPNSAQIVTGTVAVGQPNSQTVQGMPVYYTYVSPPSGAPLEIHHFPYQYGGASTLSPFPHAYSGPPSTEPARQPDP
eukprot:jgi/Mesvir1/23196/Mv22660-RA.1